MQGQGSGAGFFAEGSTSNGACLDQQMFWNSIGSSGQSPVPNFMASSGDTDMQYVNNVNHHGQTFSGWNFPESSSMLFGSAIQQHGPSNVVSSGMNFNVNLQRNGVEDANQTLLVQNSGSSQLLPQQDLNTNSMLVVEDDDCQILENPAVIYNNKPGSSRTQPIQFSSSSSNPFGMLNGSSSDGSRRLTRKRKVLEGIVEQQPRRSGSGSSSTGYIQHSDSSLRGSSSPSLNLLDQVNPSFGSSTTRQMASESSTLLANTGSMESSRRSTRMRGMNVTHQQGSLPSRINMSSSQHLLRPLPQNSLPTRPPTSMATNTNPQAQPVVGQLSSLHRNPHPVWNPPPSGVRSRNLSNFPVSGGASFDPSNSGGVPRNIISDHRMFAQASESRNSLQSGPIASGNVNNPGSQNAHPPAPSWIPPNQSPLQFPSRLSGSVRRALLSGPDGGTSAQNSTSHPSVHSVPSSSGSRRHSRHSQSRQAILLERHVDGALRIPSSVQAGAASNDVTARLLAEWTQLRNALEHVRRGEGLRPQDAMILDQSVFFGMMSMHDQHRDMRLDVDNMSYEELLALEDRIGSVNTGLSEESIMKQLKHKKHARRNVVETETEPCCICQEEYNEGEDVGTLDCGHEFHGQCIKKWLMHKNLCPICKTTGLTK